MIIIFLICYDTSFSSSSSLCISHMQGKQREWQRERCKDCFMAGILSFFFFCITGLWQNKEVCTPKTAKLKHGKSVVFLGEKINNWKDKENIQVYLWKTEESRAALPGNSPRFGWLSSGLGLLTIDAIEAIFTVCISICCKGQPFKISRWVERVKGAEWWHGQALTNDRNLWCICMHARAHYLSAYTDA